MKIKKSRLKEIIKEEVNHFLREEMDLTLQDIVKGAAKAMVASALADSGQTEEIEEIPEDANRSALNLIKSIEEENGIDLVEFIEENMPEEDPEEFGYMLASQAVGIGDGLPEELEQHELQIPYWQYSMDLEDE